MGIVTTKASQRRPIAYEHRAWQENKKHWCLLALRKMPWALYLAPQIEILQLSKYKICIDCSFVQELLSYTHHEYKLECSSLLANFTDNRYWKMGGYKGMSSIIELTDPIAKINRTEKTIYYSFDFLQNSLHGSHFYTSTTSKRGGDSMLRERKPSEECDDN